MSAKFRVLGPLEALADGVPVKLGGHRFERLASDGAELLERGQAEDAAALFRQALDLWRGPALADVAGEGVLRAAAARLDELRLVALERRIEADLACARHTELTGELSALVDEHPLRERLRAPSSVIVPRIVPSSVPTRLRAASG